MAIKKTGERTVMELDWIVEARAKLEQGVRRGVPADLPSFVKTVMIAWLIRSEFDRNVFEA